MSSKKHDEKQQTYAVKANSAKGSNIFIVEDDEIDQRLVSQSFAKRKSYEQIKITFFKTGEQLLSHLSEHEVWPSILICDINLPGMTGLETINQMADLSLNDKTPFVVVLSGSDPTLDPQFKQTSCINTYYQKPASKKDWDKIIDEICDLHLQDKNTINGSYS